MVLEDSLMMNMNQGTITSVRPDSTFCSVTGALLSCGWDYQLTHIS